MDNPQAKPLLSLCSISKGFDSKGARLEILKDVDYQIYQGDMIAVVGASGIGKSTLLHIIGTLDAPDSGSLLFEDKNLFALEEETLARFRTSKIGFVFQFNNLLQGFSAIENVMIPCLLDQKSRSEARKMSGILLERVGLENRMDHRVEDLSGGEQQRVALARALVLRPALLLADEPTGNLDAANSKEIHHLFIELNMEFDMTVVVVTHNMELAALMEKKVTLQDSKIVPVV